MTEPATSSGNPAPDPVARVSIKPPEFSEVSSSGWFAILEAQFNLAAITAQQTKFYHALAGLPATLVDRLPANILTEANYENLKAAVAGLVERSRPELFESLLAPEIFVGKPSVCLNNLQRTADKVGVGEAFVRHKFLQSLPPTVTPVLASQTTLTLSQLGNLADQLVSLTLSQQSCATVDKIPSSSFHLPVQAVNTPTEGHFHDRQSRRSTVQQHNSRFPRSSSSDTFHHSVRPFRPRQVSRICRGHIYYGNRSNTCRAWCEWPSKKQCTIGPDSRPQSPRRNVPLNDQDTL